MPSPVVLIWALLSILVSGACTFCMLQPYWLVNDDQVHSFGLVNYCHDSSVHRQSQCTVYGGHLLFSNIPSGAWQAACVLYGAGCVLACVAAQLGVFLVCLSNSCKKKVISFAAYLQGMAFLLQASGLVIYPLGFGHDLCRHFCGRSADAYSSGRCSIGWSYMIGIMGTALSIFCPFLAQFADMKANEIFE